MKQWKKVLALCLVALLGLGAVAAAQVADGTYETKAMGRNTEIKVATTIKDGLITAVEVLAHSETAGISDAALAYIPARIVQNNSVAVDAVAGATVTSDAIVEAVKAAIVASGGDVQDYMRPVETATSTAVEVYDCDVAVVGAGASGVAAAVAAADEGANVIIIEKTGVIGGASNLSWAAKFVNSEPSLADGLAIDQEALIANWIEDCHWRVDAAAIRQFVEQSGQTYNWLAEHGYQTTYMNFFGEPMHMLPDYSAREGLLRDMLTKTVEAGGGKVLTNVTGHTLLTDETGAVVGVVARALDGSTVTINAKRVVIATGGYAGNFDMVADAFGFRGVNGGLGQNVGEGLQMAWAAGAKVPDNFGGQMLHQTLAKATTSLRAQFEPFKACYPVMLTYLPSFMNVSPSGARFRDEATTLSAVAAANTSAFNGAYHYVIVSKAQLDALIAQGMSAVNPPRLPGMPPEFYADFRDQFTLENPWVDAYEVFDAMVADGNGFKGDTPEALAQAAGMDVDMFVAEFAAYEAACASGKDESFNKNATYLIPMGETGPYYAITTEINNLGSIGGLVVNKQFQVLDDGRVPVKGLYAVGNESMGVLFNDTYVGNGIGMGNTFTSGRLGGQYAAKSLQ